MSFQNAVSRLLQKLAFAGNRRRRWKPANPFGMELLEVRRLLSATAVANAAAPHAGHGPHIVSSIDLDPYAVDAPASAARGSTISVFTDVDNLGTGASGSYTVGYYLSTDATITTSDTLLKSVTRSSIAGKSYQQWSESVALAAGLTPGSYYIGVIIDRTNSIVESNEGNNAQADASRITITAPAQADLDPYAVTAPASANRGSTISVFTDVDNLKAGASGSYTINYYLSTDSTITTSDTLLKSVTRSSIAGSSYQQWNESIALASGLATGSYYIGVIVDPANKIVETNEANNAQSSTSRITISAPAQIDLSANSVDAPTSAARGATTTVLTDIRNLGTGASGTFTVNYYLSTDSTITTSDTLLKTVTRSSIAGASSQQWTESIALASGLSTGDFYIGVIVDPLNKTVESNESNNARADGTRITITGAVASGFDIQFAFSGLTTSQRAIFEDAATRWERIITGDLPNATYNGVTVDDLLIGASSVSIDGAGGILGQAGYTHLRSGSKLPYHGDMEFDSADIAAMESSGQLYSVILHEIGHVLGIGTLWETKGLLVGKGTANPGFTGAQAVAAYNAIYGTSATSVPVEGNSSPVGSRDSHWRESVLDRELMTPYIENTGVSMPLSRITVASLQDIGYTVNMSAADSFTASRSSVFICCSRALACCSTLFALSIFDLD